MSSKVLISCLCDEIRREISLRDGDEVQGSSGQVLCHCDTCRHISGLLCTSYVPVAQPSSLDGLESYSPSPKSTRYFCATCGCHLFRSTAPAANDSAPEPKARSWEAATGAIVESPEEETDSAAPHASEPGWKHLNVADTNDGGISVWINGAVPNTASGSPSKIADKSVHTAGAPAVIPVPGTADAEALPAACHCGTVHFHITRPNADSHLPRSNFTDLMMPYCRTDPEVVKNPADTKWWLRAGNTKYFAGTCACRSCRLASGFEVQTWAFVPRANIYFHIRQEEYPEQQPIQQLDFNTLPGGILKSYSSSPGVIREFCPNCGATVFWHDQWRPELIDVSVGLLRAPEGARADTWLDWWRGRVSFTEETGSQRTGTAVRRALALIQCLEVGLKDSVRNS